MDLTWGLLAVFALVFANGFFVASEFALVTVRKTRVDQLIAEGSRLARTVRRALDDPARYLAAAQLGITMASLGLGWVGEPALAALIEPALRSLPPLLSDVTAHTVAVILAFGFITALHIVLGEQAPKIVALAYPERFSLWTAKPTELFMKVFRPFIALLNGMGTAVLKLFGLQSFSGHSMVHSEEELKMLVTASQEAGVLEADEEQMLHRVFDFADLTAGQVVVPRTELVALQVEATFDDVVKTLADTPRVQLPVYRNNIDDIVGILHIKDLFRVLASPPATFELASLVREVTTVPETMKADDLLGQMRRRHTHLVIVIDEYGGTAGLVTFQGLMERIVGEFGGDSGVTGRRVTVLADGSAIVDGLALVTDINAQFGLHIDEETYKTIGGFVAGRIGRKPRIGDTVAEGSRALTVEGLDGLRVARLRISRERSQKMEDRSQKTD